VTRVIVTELAEQDSGDILDYLAREAGGMVAERYAVEFERFVDRLEDFPEIGPRRPTLGRRVRSGVIAPYILFYEYLEADDVARVLRILHGSRKIGRRHLR
jgi:toxin ParE1/3/4